MTEVVASTKVFFPCSILFVKGSEFTHILIHKVDEKFLNQFALQIAYLAVD
jgi:hypothetical protein